MRGETFLLILLVSASAAWLLGLALALGLFNRSTYRRAGFRVTRHD